MAKALVNAQGKAYICSNNKVLLAPSGYGGYDEFPSYKIYNGSANRRFGTLKGTEFSNITSINDYGFYYAFASCKNLTGNLNLSTITSIGDHGLAYAFWGCTGIESVDLSGITIIGNQGLAYAFYGCTYIEGTVNFSSLTSIGTMGFTYAFGGCEDITDVYFNSLTTTSFGSYRNQFNNMMYNTGSTTHTLHFPSNLESTISNLTGYPTFGGSSGHVVCVFDLPATS